MIYRAKRQGLNEGQRKVIQAMDAWFDEHCEGPQISDLADLSGLGRSTVSCYLPVLEALGYITVSKGRNGYNVRGSIRLWVDPAEVA
jgi:DNA-binding MarR family transcriptional regulator